MPSDVSIASIIGAGSGKGDWRGTSPAVDCEAVLERAGVSDYSIDWDSRTVYLTRKSDLRKIADYLAFNMHSRAEGFNKYGWQWMLGDQSKENKEGLL